MPDGVDRYAQMFITPEEFDRLLDRAASDLGLVLRRDSARSHGFVYVSEQPSREDGVRLQRPDTEEETLYLVQHDLRTADEALVRLFDDLRRRWNRFLARPVLGTNVAYGGATSYRTIGFTAGAFDLFQAGWRWKQDGVANVEFAPDAAALRPTPIP